MSERTRPGQRRKPGTGVVLRDLLLFLIGVGIVIKQTGFPWLLDSPETP